MPPIFGGKVYVLVTEMRLVNTTAKECWETANWSMTRFTRWCGRATACLLACGLALSTSVTATADPEISDVAAPTVAADQMPAVQTAVAVADGFDCANVTAWNALSACVQAGGVTTITQAIDVPADQYVTVSKASTLLSTVTGTALNAKYDASVANKQNAVFNIQEGGTLTIGAAGGTGFEYSGNTRVFAYVSAVNGNAGTLAVANEYLSF